MSVPNLKRIALFVQKLLGGPKITKFDHVTQARPLWGRFMIRKQYGSVLYVSAKFEAESPVENDMDPDIFDNKQIFVLNTLY